MKAIETQYKGYRFRSRLEARWAVFFDHLPVRWEYEPEGFDLGEGVRYLPDFRVTYWDQGSPKHPITVWMEIKPSIASLTDSDHRKFRAFSRANGQFGDVLFVLDGTPEERYYNAVPMGDYHVGDLKDPPEFGVALWSAKQRPWWDYDWPAGQNEESLETLRRAIAAARGARFEFGENGSRHRPRLEYGISEEFGVPCVRIVSGYGQIGSKENTEFHEAVFRGVK
jgi:hypothetical protein